jgi:hypothetical protein
MSSHAHAASERGGWGLRLHYPNGASGLNCFSMGDVCAYDTKREAETEARRIMRSWGGVRLYTKVTVEKVEKGAWAPSEYDATMLELMAFAMPEAQRGVLSAIRAINRAKALLSDHAPAHIKQPLPLPSGGSEG